MQSLVSLSHVTGTVQIVSRCETIYMNTVTNSAETQKAIDSSGKAPGELQLYRWESPTVCLSVIYCSVFQPFLLDFNLF